MVLVTMSTVYSEPPLAVAKNAFRVGPSVASYHWIPVLTMNNWCVPVTWSTL